MEDTWLQRQYDISTANIRQIAERRHRNASELTGSLRFAIAICVLYALCVMGSLWQGWGWGAAIWAICFVLGLISVGLACQYKRFWTIKADEADRELDRRTFNGNEAQAGPDTG